MHLTNWLSTTIHRIRRSCNRRVHARRSRHRWRAQTGTQFVMPHGTELLEERTLLTTEVAVVGGVLTITDIDGGDSDDDLTISYVGDTYAITDNGGLLIDASSIPGSGDNGTPRVTVPDAGIMGIRFDTRDGDDAVSVDSVQAALPGGFSIDGGTGTDTGDIRGAINTAGGDVSVSVSGGLSIAAAVSTGGGAAAFHADSDADGDGLLTLTDAGSINSTNGTPGDVSITAADVDLQGTINADTANVSFAHSQTGEPIDLGPGSPGRLPETVDLNGGDEDLLFYGPADSGNSSLSVHTADLNGDGLDDLIIGNGRGYGPGGARRHGGEVYIYLGDSSLANSSPLDADGTVGAEPDVIIYGAAAVDSLSATGALASADVNNDGTPDLIIGAQLATVPGRNRAGAVYVVYGSSSLPRTIDLASLGSNGVVIQGAVDRSSPTTQGALTTGDINGDGIQDVIIGAWQTNLPGRRVAGAVYVVYGSSSLPGTIDLASPGTNGVAVHGELLGDGISRHGALTTGDINGDGMQDLIIGAYFADAAGRDNSGAAYVVYGSASLPETIELASLGNAGLVVHGAADRDGLGYVVASDDVNGDGTPDLVVGARTADVAGRDNAGAAYIVYGSSNLPETIDLANPGDDVDVVIHGAAARSELTHHSVATLADVNDDGVQDVILGAPIDGDNGAVYVVYGSSTLPGTIDLASLGSNGVVVQGAGIDDRPTFSGALTSGDVNGDGVPDLILGAELADPAGRLSAGAAYAVYGSSSLPGTIDLGSLGGRGFVVQGATSSDRLTSNAGLTSGDLNGDGVADVVLAAAPADGPDESRTDAGEVYVVFGPSPTLPFSLTDAELGRITAGRINVGDADDGDVTFTDEITNASVLSLTSGSNVTAAVNGTAFTGPGLVVNGKLAPGASPGLFSVDGDFEFASTASFEVELNGSAGAGVAGGHDQLMIAGDNRALVLNGATLDISIDGAFTPTTPLTIINRTGTGGTLSGRFRASDGTTLNDGDIFSAGNGVLVIDYHGGDGNDVVLRPDTTPPIVTINPRTTTDDRPELTGTVDDAAATVEVNVAGQTHAATNNMDGTWTLADDTINPALPAGVHNVVVTATDAAGNVGTVNTTNELEIAVLAFDFGTPASPEAAGFSAVDHTRQFTAGQFGWLNTTGLQSRDRTSVSSDVNRDYIKTNNASSTFAATLADGEYSVTFIIGSGQDPRNNVGVSFEGTQVATVTTAPGQFETQTHLVTVVGNRLEITIEKLGSTSAGINALIILPATLEPRLDATDALQFHRLGDGPVPVDDQFVLSDPDDASLAGAEVRITGGFVANEDVLAFVDQNGITGSYDAMTGILSLTGTATLASYQAALRTVTFDSTGTATGARGIEFSASDGTTGTGFDSRSLTVLPAGGAGFRFDFNDTGSPTEAGFIPVTVAQSFSSTAGFGWLADAFANNLSARDRGAPDALRQDYHKIGSGSMTFAVDLPDGTYDVTFTIGSNQDVRNGVAVFLEDTQVPNASTTFSSTAGQFITQTHRATVSDGRLEVKLEKQGSSGISINGLEIAEVTGAPGIRLTAGSAVFESGSGAIVIDNALTVEDIDSSDLTGATVSIIGGFDSAADTLSFTDQNGITGTYAMGTGILTLTGTTTVANYQAALRTVQFSTTDTSGARTVQFEVDDGTDTGAGTRDIFVTVPFAGTARYDFGSPTSPVEAGFTRVSETLAFDPALGFGLISTTNVESRVRQGPVPLDERHDYVRIGSGSMTFAVSLPNGDYDVQITIGSSENARNNVGVIMEGTQVDTINTAVNQFAVETHRVTVTDNRLEVEIARQGSSGASINALVITEV